MLDGELEKKINVLYFFYMKITCLPRKIRTLPPNLNINSCLSLYTCIYWDVPSVIMYQKIFTTG